MYSYILSWSFWKVIGTPHFSVFALTKFYVKYSNMLRFSFVFISVCSFILLTIIICAVLYYTPFLLQTNYKVVLLLLSEVFLIE